MRFEVLSTFNDLEFKFFNRDNIKLFIKHSVVLQLAMAVINSSKVEENSNIEEIQSAEKVTRCYVESKFVNCGLFLSQSFAYRFII